MKTFKFILGMVLLLQVSIVKAEPYDIELNEAVTAFQTMVSVPAADILVPTVVELPINGFVPRSENFLVLERESGNFIGSVFTQKQSSLPIPATIEIVPLSEDKFNLIDGRLETYTEFPIEADGQNTVKIIFDTNELIATSQLNLVLDEFVALPLTVEIQVAAEDGALLGTVLASKKVTDNFINFPEVTAKHFEVSFTYAQPLRIKELNFIQKNAQINIQQNVRFLAQPQMSYDVYYQADKQIFVDTLETGDLYSDEGVLKLANYKAVPNPSYVAADVDEDGVRDRIDNCVQVSNADQVDIDKNGRGDACEDFDRDGLVNYVDNCANQPNENQGDEDGDSIGDVCDDEESRFTERNPWILWVGMGIAGFVILILFALVAKGKGIATSANDSL